MGVNLKEIPIMPPCIQPRIATVVQSEFLLTLQYAGTVQKLPFCHDDQIIQDWRSNLQLDFQSNPGFKHYLETSLKVFLTKVLNK